MERLASPRSRHLPSLWLAAACVLHVAVALVLPAPAPRRGAEEAPTGPMLWMSSIASPQPTQGDSQPVVAAQPTTTQRKVEGAKGPAKRRRAVRRPRRRTEPVRTQAHPPASTGEPSLATLADPSQPRPAPHPASTAEVRPTHGAAMPEAAASAPHAPTPSGSGSAVTGTGAIGQPGGAQGTGQRGNRGPVLISHGNPCAGYFPARAATDHGEVRIAVGVDRAGMPGAGRVLFERPAGQGFGQAAEACARALRFAPARSINGLAVAGQARLRLRFGRR